MKPLVLLPLIKLLAMVTMSHESDRMFPMWDKRADGVMDDDDDIDDDDQTVYHKNLTDSEAMDANAA